MFKTKCKKRGERHYSQRQVNKICLYVLYEGVAIKNDREFPS